MNKKAILILTIFTIFAASPASAWFWDNKEVKAPESNKEMVKKTAPESAVKSGKQKGFMDIVRETGRDIKLFFRKTGKGAKKTSKEVAKEAKQVPGDLKKESKSVAKSLKGTDKKIAKDAKKGAKAVGKAFKQLGKDIKDSTKKTFTED